MFCSLQCVALAAFHYGFSGVLRFPIGVILFAASAAMLFASVGFPPVITGQLEQFSFQGETVFSFQGRLMVDALLIVGLIIFVGKWFLAVAVAAVIGAVVALKDRETELFNEVFRSPGDSSVGAGYGAGDNLGGYQSVDT